ncbi:MAG TPA: class D sortase [Bryobacteraceae bacterium]|nr:class D sortase [Bryobacteraceae bacterium]
MQIKRHAGSILAIVGLLLAGYAVYDGFGGRIYQAWRGPQLDRELTSIPNEPPAMHRADMVYEKGSAIGRLEIPRLGLSVVVLEGSDRGTLRLGVGRVPNSSLPGESGNVVLAGHRDTFFSALRDIRPGDRISLRTTAGKFAYTVGWTEVVKPSDTGVLMPTASPALTLVTCYPFTYVGSAPKRFIVRAMPGTESSAARMPDSGKPSPFGRSLDAVQPAALARVTAPLVHTVAARSYYAVPDEPARQQPGRVKRALRKIAGVFSSHRDTLQ